MRRMREPDVTAVARAEASTFSSPWREDTLRSLLGRSDAELWVADLDGEVAGYAILWRILKDGELASIVVREELRGQGIGSALLVWMLGVAERAGVRNLYLEARESNQGALRLYRGCGFEEVGVRERHYEHPQEDALVLKVTLGEDGDGEG